MKKIALVEAVVALGYDEKTARSLIMAGRVKVDERIETKGGTVIDHAAKLVVTEAPNAPSRAAGKLSGALDKFKIAVDGRICFDLGAAHGGFTHTLLSRGARRVYAIDVAYGMLDYKLRSDERVVVLERKNVRDITSEWFTPDDLDSAAGIFVVCDVAFISMKTVLASLKAFRPVIKGSLEGVYLIKPQFEASHLTDGGVLKDQELREKIVSDVVQYARELGFELKNLAPADVAGMSGNIEYTAHLAL